MMNHSEIFISGLFLFVSICMAILLTQKKKVSHDFYLRVRSWWWMLGILCCVTLIPFLLPLLLLFIGLLACREIAIVSQLNKAQEWALLIAILSLLLIMYWLSLDKKMIYISVTSFVILLYMASFLARRMSSKSDGMTVTNTFVLLSILILSLGEIIEQDDQFVESGYLLYLFFTVQFSDVCQYFFGKEFGRTALAKQISPNKTLEGALYGATFSAVFASFIAIYITPLHFAQAIVISLALATLGILGDLYMSWFKRRWNVKDMGNLIPGHGGILDRVDSLLLSSPFLAFTIVYLINK